MKIEVFLDNQATPYTVLEPPEKFKLDTNAMTDGSHRLRFKATDKEGQTSIREISFVVSNGPGIAVHGIDDNDVVRDKISVLANAYSNTTGDTFEPMRIETPAPIPTWAWLIFLAVFAWGMWYLGIELHARQLELAENAGEDAAGSVKGEGSASDASWKVLGEQIYGNYCSSCHQVSGEGLPGVFPALKNSPVVVAADPAEHTRIILKGLEGNASDGVTYSAPMPPFADQLSDEEIAAVVNHERSTWGNASATITPEEVAALR